MHEISTLKGLSVNAIQNVQLKRKYEKHINKVLEIGQKKSNVNQICEEQRKISEILKKSKSISKSFKDKQLMQKCQQQNKRLEKSLSTIHTRQKVKTERAEDQNHLRKRIKTLCKQGVLREFEIERQNRKLAQNIMENVADVHRYRKKMEKEITQYERLKTQLQRLKPIYLEKISQTYSMHNNEAKIRCKNLQTDRLQTQKTLQLPKTIRFHDKKSQ